MICKNCGAEFNYSLPKCPYCGEFHYAGAEKEYMGKLEDMKENLNELHDTVPKMYAGELKSQAKQLRKIVLIVAIILAALTLFVVGFNFFMDSYLYGGDAKERLLFTKTAFPIADEYYEAGDYDGLLEFYQTSIEENENADFYDWEHYAFLICYENLDSFRKQAAWIGTENFSEFSMQDLFYLYIMNHYYQKGYPMEAADQQLVSSFEDEMEAVIDSFELTKEELNLLNDLLNSEEYPSWNETEKLAKTVYERIY